MNLAGINERMSKMKEWAIDNGALVKDYPFQDFKSALDFINKVAEIAEKHNHHPDILISCNNVRLTLITRSERSITEKDFDVAEDIDRL